MKWPAALFVGSLAFACSLCEIFALTLVPLATAWSIGRWGVAPFRALGRLPMARPRRPV